MRLGHRSVILLLLSPLLFALTTAIGFNYGTSSSHPLPPSKVVTGLLQPNNITKIKLFDANAEALESLSSLSGFSVIIGIPNDMLKLLNQSKKAAGSWVHDNVTRYLASTGGLSIEYIALGDEPFRLSYGQQFQPYVIGAAMNIFHALTTAKLSSKIKVVVPCSFDILQSKSTANTSAPFPLPSKSHFRYDLNKTMIELLTFLSKQGSPFVLDINPFPTFQEKKNHSLDFFLFHPKAKSFSDGHVKYTNFFDVAIDMLVTSLSKAGFKDMDVMVGKIGWPTDGEANATSTIAQTFTHNLIDHLKGKSGTPLRPKRPPLETYIFSLLDEDERSITTGNFERHFGLFTFDGQAKYNVNLNPGKPAKELVNAHNVDYLPSKWCVLRNNNDDLSNITAVFEETCSKADCTALSRGGSCYGIQWPGNISYAFNSYYQMHDQSGDGCYFGGLGLITTVDPSVGNCRFSVAIQTSLSSALVGLTIVWKTIVLSCYILYLI